MSKNQPNLEDRIDLFTLLERLCIGSLNLEALIHHSDSRLGSFSFHVSQVFMVIQDDSNYSIIKTKTG